MDEETQVIRFIFFLVGLYLSTEVFAQSTSNTPVRGTASDYSPDFIVVRTQTSEIFGQKAAANGRSQTPGRRVERALPFMVDQKNTAGRVLQHPLSNIFKVYLNEGENLNSIIAEYAQMPEVIYAEAYPVCRPLIIPNDPEASPGVGRQTYLQVIRAYDAWSIEPGDPNIVIGSLDSGIEIDHLDLMDNVAYNLADPINGIDDDGDGLVDNYMGWDIANNDNNPAADTDNHGTQIAGMSSASTNNTVGIASTGYNSRFVPYKIFTSGSNFFFGGYEAIALAADLGCKVINLSWGAAGSYSQFAQDIINYAVLEKDAVIVAAAGNTPELLDFYPASYDNVLSVGATQLDDQKADFATFSYNIDLMAPGVNIYTTNNGGSYTVVSGTSLSSPMVAGLAALVRARFPTLNAQQVMQRIRVNTDDIYGIGTNANYNGQLGSGRLNMLKALTDNSSSAIRIEDFVYTNGTGSYAFYGDTLDITLGFKNFLYPSVDARVRISSPSPYVEVIDEEFVIGSLSTLAQTTNAEQPFRIILSHDLPPNEPLHIRFDFSDGSYKDFQYITITSSPSELDYDNGKLTLTLGSDGTLGYTEDFFSGGIGLQNEEQQLINAMGLIVATDENAIMDNVPNNLALNVRDTDFKAEQNVRFARNSIAEYDARLAFSGDPTNPDFPDVRIEQKTLSEQDADFLIQEYRVINTGPEPLANLQVALFADWDLNDKDYNRVMWLEDDKMGYAFDVNSQNLYTGIALLTSQEPLFFAINNKNFNGNLADIPAVLNDSIKYSLVSQGLFKLSAGDANNGNDISEIIGGTISDLEANGAEKITFALVTGTSLGALQLALQEAKDHYDEYLSQPPILETFFTCLGEPATIDPRQGASYAIYSDLALENLLYEGEVYTTAAVSEPTTYYAVNQDNAYRGDVVRIITSPKPVDADFDISANPLLLDESGQTRVTMTDRSTDAVDWQWTFSHGFTASVQNPNTNFTTPGVYTIDLTVRSDLGCEESIAKTVEVAYRSRQPAIGDFQICAGENVNFDPENATLIEVYDDENLTSKLFEGEEFRSDPVWEDRFYYVVGKDSAYQSLAKKVQVNVSRPNADFSHQPDTTTLERHAIQLTDKSQYADLHFWKVNDEVAGINGDLTYVYDPEQPLDIVLYAENSEGCLDSLAVSIISSAANKPMEIDTTLCTGGDFRLAQPQNPFLNFYSDASLSTLVEKGKGIELQNIVQDTTIFYTDLEGYGESDPAQLRIRMSEVHSAFTLPQRTFTLSGSLEVHPENSSLNGVQYTWVVNDSLTSTDVDPLFSFRQTGDYVITLLVQDEYGCTASSSDTLTVVSITGLETPAETIHIYPNPAEDVVIIGGLDYEFIGLFDIEGRKMSMILENHGRLNTSQLRPGIYHLKLLQQNEVIIRKLIKR